MTAFAASFPPLRGVREGEVSASYADGGVMSHTDAMAHDPSDAVGRRHLPALRAGRNLT